MTNTTTTTRTTYAHTITKRASLTARTQLEQAILAYQLANQDPYARAYPAVYCVLRAKIRDSGLQMYIDLQNSRYSDKDTAQEWQLESDRATAEQTAKALATLVKNLEKTSTNIKTPQADREKALEQLPALRADLAKAQSTLDNLTDALKDARTFTDRQDLLQVAYIQDRTNSTNPAPITAEMLATIGKTEDDELTLDEWVTLQSKANFSAICKAVHRHMDTLPTAQTLDKVTKKYIPQTQQQADEWAEMYGGIGKDIKVHVPRKRTRASECFATMEYFSNKTRKGFFKVFYYLTTAPVTYIEQYTNSDEEETTNTIDNYIKYTAKSAPPQARNISTTDTHTALLHEVATLNRDKLTKRQAEFLETFLKLEKYSDSAKAYHIEHKSGAYTTSQAEEWAYKRRIEKAFALMGIDNKETQRKTLYRLAQNIKPRTTDSKPTHHSTDKPAPIVVPDHYKTTAEHGNRERTAPSVAPLFSKWDRATTAEPSAVNWKSAEQAEQARRAYTERAEQQHSASHIDNTTANAIERATLAELLYIEREARREQADRERKHNRERENAKREAERNGVKTTLNTTAEDWRRYTPKQRELLKAYLKTL